MGNAPVFGLKVTFRFGSPFALNHRPVGPLRQIILGFGLPDPLAKIERGSKYRGHFHVERPPSCLVRIGSRVRAALYVTY